MSSPFRSGVVDERWYAPLDKPSLLVHEISITAAKVRISVALVADGPPHARASSTANALVLNVCHVD